MIRKSISIALCTYNGERFLNDQLDSYCRQSRLPDELIICDDASQDGTVQLIHDFVKRAPFCVKFYRNDKNLGYKRNFEQALSLCSGDIVALSDQDDIWLENKLERCEQVFLSDPSVGYVFCDGLVVDEKSQSLGYTMWDVYGIFKKRQYKYQPMEFTKILLSKRGVIQGCLLVMRQEVIKYALPLPETWGHDSWICFAGSLFQSVVKIPDVLIKYRLHSQNAGPLVRGRRTSRLGYLKVANLWVIAQTRIRGDDRFFKYRSALESMIETKIKHVKARGNMPKNLIKRLYIITKEIFSLRYFKYSRGVKSIGKDILYLD